MPVGASQVRYSLPMHWSRGRGRVVLRQLFRGCGSVVWRSHLNLRLWWVGHAIRLSATAVSVQKSLEIGSIVFCEAVLLLLLLLLLLLVATTCGVLSVMCNVWRLGRGGVREGVFSVCEFVEGVLDDEVLVEIAVRGVVAGIVGRDSGLELAVGLGVVEADCVHGGGDWVVIGW